MRILLAVLLGKLIAFLSRYFELGGGSAAPGLYALKIYPGLVEELSQQMPKNVVITGTNGKTTTAKMLAHFARTKGMKVIRNHTGSNLERGIVSTLLQNSRLHLEGVKLNFDLGIWELDEAAFNSVAPKLKPDVAIFLNVFRDQLDRYGEIDSVVKNWCQTLKSLPGKTMVLVNGDDINTLKLAACFKGSVQKFGVKDFKIVGESIEHLQENENLDFEASNVKLNGLTSSSFQLHTTNYQLPTTLPLPGIYHIYDFLASFAAGVKLGFVPEQMVLSLKNYSPAFGRVEKLPFGYIFLIKNPAGATQVFETIAPNIRPQDRLLLALNDNIADGTDVSWIWDANFEVLQNSSRAKSRDFKLCISGARAYDLAVRLKYAGFKVNPSLGDKPTFYVEPSLENAFKQARQGLKGQLFILPTYTAMLELQSVLVKSGLKKHYWKEEN